ncbi:pre-rRNA-processing protein pno1 [Colletotrichum chrysophilum]|uniref:Pre-rRNA-processing protein PNO1 n=1 Tax=Colletotrichum chrysophilum TaxID=1836956 RepID=A0AAD9A341_9PEZI|nr:pre-rRNA-processing protein pno1 [Colletotrichum chrysophilum]
MPAPTAKQVEIAAPPPEAAFQEEQQDEELLLDAPTALPEDLDAIMPSVPQNGEESEMVVDEENRPRFAPARDIDPVTRIETRKVPVPPHRFTPLKSAWPKIYPPLVEHLKLQVRMNPRRKQVELRTSKHSTEDGALQKGEDFVKAFTLGFDVDDAIALLRLDDLYSKVADNTVVETFEIRDVKQVMGNEAQGRAIGRIAGKDGKTKFAIENASKTRIVLADSKIHILGAYKNIHMARESIVSLILGKPPSKVYGNLRTVAARMKERF